MPGSPALPSALLIGFLLALARVSGVVAFFPLPGLRNAPDMARIVFALALTLCLAPAWPSVTNVEPGLATLTGWMLIEAAFGVLMGLFISVLVESFQLGAQILGLQAGFSYASTIDPSSQADSTILQVFAQLLAATLFFALGLDRQLIALLAKSFQTIPPGTFRATRAVADQVIAFAGTLFANGLRIAFPVVALLLLVDIALALLGRMHAQLQMLTVAFPAKMLAGIWFFAATLWVMPAVAESMLRRALETAAKVVAP